jgi:hypothetical protein
MRSNFVVIILMTRLIITKNIFTKMLVTQTCLCVPQHITPEADRYTNGGDNERVVHKGKQIRVLYIGKGFEAWAFGSRVPARTCAFCLRTAADRTIAATLLFACELVPNAMPMNRMDVYI